MRFPPAALRGAAGGIFLGRGGGQRWANVCLPEQHLWCCRGFLRLVVELGLRRLASLLTCLHAGHSFCPHGGRIWHASFSCDDNVVSDVEGRSGCLDASCPMR